LTLASPNRMRNAEPVSVAVPVIAPTPLAVRLANADNVALDVTEPTPNRNANPLAVAVAVPVILPDDICTLYALAVSVANPLTDAAPVLMIVPSDE
jgi:hypothetical protein